MKNCRTCGIKKSSYEFHKHKREKDGYRVDCKSCRAIETKEYREKYPDIIKKRKRDYYEENKEGILKSQHEYYEENNKYIRARERKRRLDNHEIFLAKEQEYRDNHRNEIYEKNRRYSQEKRYVVKIKNREREKQKNPEYKLMTVLRKRVTSLVKKQKFHKSGSAIKDLGCTLEELLAHLESKFYSHPITREPMSWENYGRGPKKWQADHIKGIRFFDISDRKQFLIAFNFNNLQPLWHEDHIIKNKEERKLAKALKR